MTEIQPDFYHKFLAGIVYGYRNNECKTKLCIHQGGLRITTEVALPMLVREVATTQNHCILSSELFNESKTLFGFNLTNPTEIYQFSRFKTPTKNAYSNLIALRRKERLEMDHRLKFNFSSLSIAATESYAYTLEENKVWKIFSDESFPLIQPENKVNPSAYELIEFEDDIQFIKDEKLIQIAAGSNHIVVLSSTGRVFTTGYNTRGELGIGKKDDKTLEAWIAETRKFRQVKGFNSEIGFELPIHKISCGFFHTFALTENGKFFFWGWNKIGQLGDSCAEETIISSPCEMVLDTSEDYDYIDVVAEMDGTLFLLKDRATGEEALQKYGDMWDSWL